MSPPRLQRVLVVESQQLMATDDSSPPLILSPSLSSQSSVLPAVSTPPRTVSQRRSSSLFSLSLSSSLSSSSTSSLPQPVSRSLSFQMQSSSPFLTTSSSFSLSHALTASTFDAMSDDATLPTEEREPLQLVTPPPLVSKKSASHLRMANRSQQPLPLPIPIGPLQTPSKHETMLERVDDSNKENAASASARQPHTPRSHKDLFAVHKETVHGAAVSVSARRAVEGARGVAWQSEERRRLRSIR